MKRLALFLALAASVSAQTLTTLTGTIKDLSGATVTSGRIVFTTTLNPGQDMTIPGVGRFVPSTTYCRISASGQPVSNTSPYTAPCTITKSTALSPSGTSYATCVQPYNVQPGGCFNFFATLDTVDISTIAPTPTTLPINYTGIMGPPFDVQGAWSSTFSYTKGQVVSYGSAIYISLVTPNLNHQPDISSTQWGIISQPSSIAALGVTTFAQLQSAVTTCGVAPCSIPISANIPFASNFLLPANVNPIASGGMLCPASGVTLTIAGPITAPLSQIFCGAGTINGLLISRPEWFGSGGTVTMAAAALAGGGQLLVSPNAFPAGGAITKSNISIIGSGQALYNGSNTAFTAGSGSIIQGNLSIKGSSLTFRNFSIDNGSALGTCTDGLTVSSGGIAQPFLTDITVDHVSTLLCTPTTAFHSILIEGVNRATVSNVQTINGIYGVVLKCQNCTAQHVVSMAHSMNCFLVKSDTLFALAAYVDADDVRCTGLVAGDTGPAMVQGAAALAQKVSFRNFKLMNLSGTALQIYAFALGGSNGTVADVDVDNLVIDTVPSGTGVQTIADSTSNILRFHINSPTINNTNVPIFLGAPAGQIDVNNAILTNATGDGINNFATTASFFNTNCWNVTGGCIHDHTGLPAVKVFGINVQPPAGGIGGGPPFIDSTGFGQPNISANYLAGNVPTINASSVYSGGLRITVSALATAVPIPGTGAGRGHLILADETAGGVAEFSVDPNAGAQLLGTSQITGITTAAAITQVSGVWNVTLASGAVPRTLSWVFLRTN